MAGVAQRRCEHARAVAGAVIRHHRADLDAGVREERSGAFPEPGRGLFALVPEGLRVGQSRVVVDGVVQVGVAAALLVVVPVSGLSAKHAVATTVGDTSKLLDVDVDELAGRGCLVADRRGFADG
jgi:hypothetical protein